MESIPQIKTQQNTDGPSVKYVVAEEISTNLNEEGSILIPKLDANNARSGNRVTRFMKSMIKTVKFNKSAKILIVVASVLLIFVMVIGILTINVYRNAQRVRADFDLLATFVKNQDLVGIKNTISETKSDLNKLGNAYKPFLVIKAVPWVGGYIADGERGLKAALYGLEASEVVIAAIEPYADIIGLKNGKTAESGIETAQDRLDFVIATLPNLAPKANDLAGKLTLIKNEIDNIDPYRYPEKFRGIAIRDQLKKTIGLIDTGSELMVSAKPLLESADTLMGVDTPKEYLIIFQNDKELRPTGGFITAYSIAKVDKGKFEPVISSDIYNLDNKYKPVVPAPSPIIKYLKGPYIASSKLRLRDMNWSPDFPTSMELFIAEAKKAGIGDIDGIIAVDTQFLVNLLDVLGPIGVSGYGNFSTQIVAQCNCPQVIYELESFADIEGPIVWSENEPGKIVFAPANYDNRKKIIGPLMNSILSNTLGQPKEKLPALFEAGITSLTQKHILFYVFDAKAQSALEAFGIAGNIKKYDGDYLHVNDANLGGRKSNMYATSEVVQDVDIKQDGTIEKSLILTYKNPEKQDGWLNSILPNWIRIYVPLGSELISIDGLEDKVEPYTELDKTVFAGYFQLRPQGVTKVTVKYKLPFKVTSDYKLLIQKQPGTDSHLYTLTLGKQNEEFFLKTDREIKLKIK